MGPLVLWWSSTGPQNVVVRLSIYAWGVALKGQLTHRFVSNGEGFAVNEWVAVGFQYETYFGCPHVARERGVSGSIM